MGQALRPRRDASASGVTVLLGLVFLGLVVGSVGSAFQDPQQPTAVTVSTDSGPVTGYAYESYRVWKGIPYAAPPVGSLRWRAPQPVKPWGPQPLKAFDYGPACPQHCMLPPGFCPTVTSEDCLHLNVWTPSQNPNPAQPWAVLVFFAGGAFFQGDGSTPIYSGDVFVNFTSTVMVTCSYRLGALGFLVLDGLEGNYGIEDQRQVLRWVQKNIKNFGGDPNSVTVFGESAGAMSIGLHLTSPQSAGLFHKAIMESNPFSIEYKHIHEAKQDGAQLAGYLGCPPTDMACLLSKTPEEIVVAQEKVFVWPWPDVFDFNFGILLQWTPTIDGKQFFSQPINAFIAGNFTRVPIMLGTNADEGVMFVYQGFKQPTSDVAYVTAVALAFRESSFEVLEEYPVSFWINDSRPALSKVVTDYLFGCSTRRVALATSSWGVPTYLYYFDHALSFPAAYGPHYQFCRFAACHGSELPMLFHTAIEMGFNYTQPEDVMSKAMMHWWSNFAKSKTGNPNFGNNVNMTWLPFTSQALNNARIATPVSPQKNLEKAYCDFWDSLGYDW
jgi:carboxylesterase type B